MSWNCSHNLLHPHMSQVQKLSSNPAYVFLEEKSGNTFFRAFWAIFIKFPTLGRRNHLREIFLANKSPKVEHRSSKYLWTIVSSFITVHKKCKISKKTVSLSFQMKWLKKTRKWRTNFFHWAFRKSFNGPSV